MYGLVNRAMEEMVLLHHGADVWNQIKAKAEVDIDIFIANEGYPDEITYRLATAAAETLSLPIEQVLHAFGEHWILEVGSKSYSGMMEAGGRTFPEFLANLPRFHDRVSLAFPHLNPPVLQGRCRVCHRAAPDLHHGTCRPRALRPGAPVRTVNQVRTADPVRARREEGGRGAPRRVRNQVCQRVSRTGAGGARPMRRWFRLGSSTRSFRSR